MRALAAGGDARAAGGAGVHPPRAGRVGFFQPFTIELRKDRTARITSFEDDDGRPLAVPAEVGWDGSSVSVVLDRESFRAGQAAWSSRSDPPLEEFGFSVTTIAAAGESSSVLDNLGSAPSATFRYPDGGLWRSRLLAAALKRRGSKGAGSSSGCSPQII